MKDRPTLAALILGAAILAAYLNSFSTGFVQDSLGLILGDGRVHEATSRNIGLIFSQPALVAVAPTNLYRPLTTLSYLFNFAILGNGQNPSGYHLVNIILHIANAFLVYLVATLIFSEFWPALFTALIWAL